MNWEEILVHKDKRLYLHNSRVRVEIKKVKNCNQINGLWKLNKKDRLASQYFQFKYSDYKAQSVIQLKYATLELN